MLIKRPADIASSEITDKKVYVNRRQFIRAAAGTAAVAGGLVGAERWLNAQQPAAHGKKLVTQKSSLSTTETPNTWEHITTYNNYYEFGTDKGDPSIYSRNFKAPEPWTLTIEGECAKKGPMTLEDALKGVTLEDRIYRHRCVEAWSMVIPWVGFSLGDFIKKLGPTAKAKYVEFYTLYDPRRMPGQVQPVLDWPYVEGLRLDEAYHPLSILAVGLYGEVLPNQDGFPIRLVVPWKYGFKGGKAITKIRLVEKEPLNTWKRTAPNEYGFYANVNPNVDHPRWSQKKERRLPSLFQNRNTEMFNGYGDQVASLYTGLDLKKNF